MAKKVTKNLFKNLSKAYGPDCVPVVVLKNCEPEILYILAEIFNKCLKESCFPDCWKVSLVVPVFKNVGGRSIISKVLEDFVNNRIVDYIEKCSLFFDF